MHAHSSNTGRCSREMFVPRNPDKTADDEKEAIIKPRWIKHLKMNSWRIIRKTTLNHLISSREQEKSYLSINSTCGIISESVGDVFGRFMLLACEKLPEFSLTLLAHHHWIASCTSDGTMMKTEKSTLLLEQKHRLKVLLILKTVYLKGGSCFIPCFHAFRQIWDNGTANFIQCLLKHWKTNPRTLW